MFTPATVAQNSGVVSVTNTETPQDSWTCYCFWTSRRILFAWFDCAAAPTLTVQSSTDINTHPCILRKYGQADNGGREGNCGKHLEPDYPPNGLFGSSCFYFMIFFLNLIFSFVHAVCFLSFFVNEWSHLCSCSIMKQKADSHGIS